MQEATPFEGWAILELMGHRRLGGFVREITLAGAGMLRIDIPGKDGEPEIYATQIYPPSAIYCLTPTTEPVARAAAAAGRPEPVHQWEMRPALPAGPVSVCAKCDGGFGPGETAVADDRGHLTHDACADEETVETDETPKQHTFFYDPDDEMNPDTAHCSGCGGQMLRGDEAVTTSEGDRVAHADCVPF